MQIKQQALAQQIQKKIAPIYVLIGQDNYLLEEAFNIIKSTIKKSHDCDGNPISVNSADDWRQVTEEANSYSLFSETTFIIASFEKKTIDAAGKKILMQYLNSVNTRSFIVIRAPNVAAKQIMWLAAHEQVVVVVAYPLSSDAMKNWIASQLRSTAIEFEPDVPGLIHQYTQGNMLACAQVIEKIALAHSANSRINAQHVLEHLSDQCSHSLFELIDACLLGQADKAIQILRQAAQNKTEAVLILWMLTQELRNLSQLFFLMSQKINMTAAANQLKIWPQRVGLYQISLKRLDDAVCQKLLHQCQMMDDGIKSGTNTHIWMSLERLALSICLGRTCTV
ncbi:MAG: DNA polymerase III subunit delta [Legionellales bacterium]